VLPPAWDDQRKFGWLCNCVRGQKMGRYLKLLQEAAKKAAGECGKRLRKSAKEVERRAKEVERRGQTAAGYHIFRFFRTFAYPLSDSGFVAQRLL
jgi:hypothetical protein